MAQQPTFRPYTGGIQPIQGQIEAGARIGQMYQQGLSSLGAGLAEGIKEYYKNSALNDQAAAEAESAAGNLTRMMAMLGQSPEYAPFVQQYSPLLEKAKKAPTMGMSQRLALANELKVATQNLGTDMQFYQMGIQSRARNIAAEKAGTLEGAEVPVGEQNVGIGIVLNPAKNTTSQLNSYREKYNELNKRTGGKAGTWFGFLKKQQAQIEASVDAIPDNYFKQYDPNIDPKVARDRMKADVRDYVANEEKTYIQSKEAFKDVTAENIRAGLAQAGAAIFGGSEARQGARDYFSGLGRRVGEVSAMAQEADKRAMEMGEMAAPLEGAVKKQETQDTIQKIAEETVAKRDAQKTREEALIGNKKEQQIAYLRSLRTAFENPNTNPNAFSGNLRLPSQIRARVEHGGASFGSLYDKQNVSSLGEVTVLGNARFDELGNLGEEVVRAAGLSGPTWSQTKNLARAIPEAIGLAEDARLTPEQRIAGIREIDRRLAELQKPETAVSKEQKVSALTKKEPAATASTPAQPRLVPSFGVANAVIGKETIKAQMGVAQKKQIVADYVKKQMGFDSATIDAVVSNMFPSDGPDLRVLDTPLGKVMFAKNEKGGWNQVTGSASGEKSWGTFGQMTSDGKLIPKTIQSAGGGVQVRLAGQFQGPDSAFVKFNDGLVSYLDGMEAAKRLQEIINMGAGTNFDVAMKAEGANLVARIKAAVRTEVVGTGSISNYEQQLIDEIILNPTNFWSLTPANRARVTGIQEKMNNHLINTGRVWGVNVSTNLQSNSERESELRMMP